MNSGSVVRVDLACRQQVLAAENKEDHKRGDENKPECDRGAELISARQEATTTRVSEDLKRVSDKMSLRW
jgi:hypothetical protein